MTNPLSHERKKSITLATVPRRGMACLPTSVSMRSFGTPRIRSVSIGVGPSALTVIPNGASSRAITSVNATTAAFDDIYAASPSSLSGTATVLKFTMRP